MIGNKIRINLYKHLLLSLNMKKLLLLLAPILTFLLIIPSAFAISTSIDSNATYQPGQTLIAEITGNILEPITNEDITLKRKNVQVPWEFDVKRLDDKYFLWGIMPNEENNYTLYINNIATTVQGKVEEIDFNQSISTQGGLVSYSINPGFISTKDDFEFDIFLNKDTEESITVSFPEEHQITLEPGQNTLKFDIDIFEQGFHSIQIGMYNIPVLIIKIESEQTFLPTLRFYPRNIDSVVLFNEGMYYPFSIINSEDLEITDLELVYDSDIFLIKPALPGAIGAGETIDFNLTVLKPNQLIDKKILLRYGDTEIDFPVFIEYTENIDETKTPYLDEGYSETQGYYCIELNGKICSAEQICSGEVVSSLDTTSCCLDSCTSGNEKTSYAWIGYLIAAIILIVIVIIGARYLKTRKQKNPFEKRAKQAEEAIKPNIFPFKPKPEKK